MLVEPGFKGFEPLALKSDDDAESVPSVMPVDNGERVSLADTLQAISTDTAGGACFFVLSVSHLHAMCNAPASDAASLPPASRMTAASVFFPAGLPLSL